MLLLLLTTMLTSSAQNVIVSMEDFAIAPGEQKVVDINVTNDVPYGIGLGGDIYLPTGLKIVPNEDGDYLTRNMDRCTSSHALTAATKAENNNFIEGQIRFSLLSQSGKTMKGNEGAVVSFTVEATDELAEDSKITFKDAYITNTSDSYVVADCEANVHNSSYVASVLTLTAQDFALTPTKQVNLSFDFTTNKEVSALQADITLPAGLEFVENEDGEYATFNMSRLSSSHTPSTTLNGNKLNIILSSTKSSNLKGEDGELFYITLKATGDLAAESTITANRIIASTSTGSRLNIEAIDIKVSNPDVAAKAEADEKITEVKSSFEEAQTAIASYDESVQTKVQADIEAIKTKLTEIDNTLADDVTNGNVAANAEARNASIEDVKALIAALSQNAADAQAAYEANEAQHTADLEAIAEVQTALDNAKAEIEKLTESVQAGVAEDIAAAETAVDALTTTAEASYAAGTSVADAETLAADIAAAKAQIDALSKKAADAQAAYDANEAQHTADLEAIEDVQTKLNAAKATVAGYVESVQSAFAETITTLETSIAGLTTTAENSYNNGTSVADAAALQENIAAVVADIDKLLADAAAAQLAYDANEAQHTADLEAIDAAKTKLGEVMKTIDGYSQSVQDDMAEAEAAAQSKIEELKAAAEKSYTEGTSVADKEAFNAAIAALHTQIDNLAADAEAAQKGYDANEAQHSKDLAAIKEVKAALDAAKAEIAELAESVQAGVAEDIKAAEDAVAALTAAAEASYTAGTSVADAETLAAAIADANAQIDALKKKAADNQAAYEANEAQHTADLASIEDVQAKFDAVKDKISGYEQSVQELVAEDIARIQQLIDEASAAAEKSYAEGTSVADAEVLKAQIMAIEAQITALDTKAAFEQEKAYLRGDIDETGKVDINDLAIIRDLILGKSDAEELTEKQQQAADLNGDGKYSVVDLVMLNNVIVYGNPDGPAVTNAKDATLAGMESGSLSMKIEAGRMDIALNSGMPYAAIQMDITMPEGISMDDMTFAGTSDKVIIARNVLENGVCRILMYTADNSVMIDRETSLLSIKLAGNGDGIVSIDNIIAATSRGEGRALAAINGNFTIVTGINAVGTDNMSETSVFDTNGIKRQTMRKGINIVRDAAGRVKKVLVK